MYHQMKCRFDNYVLEDITLDDSIDLIFLIICLLSFNCIAIFLILEMKWDAMISKSTILSIYWMKNEDFGSWCHCSKKSNATNSKGQIKRFTEYGKHFWREINYWREIPCTWINHNNTLMIKSKCKPYLNYYV